MMAVAPLPPPPPAPLPLAEVRSYDGTGNNLANPEWGSTNEQLLRRSPAAYADGVSAPSGADRPSARLVS
ncbi:MAG: peroxidase family protein, partial [Planctomycetia bacterium]